MRAPPSSGTAVDAMSRYWSDVARGLIPYVPGEQPKLANLVKLNTNESPYGPSRRVLEALRGEMGKLQSVAVEQGGREIPGAYLLKLGFEKGARGLGLLTKMKEKTIFRVLLQPGEYNDAALRELVKNPPKLG